MVASVQFWTIFHVFLLFFLIIDWKLSQRRLKIPLKIALSWTLFWIVLALGFNAWIYGSQGKTLGLEFFTAYLIEKSLSIDNLFVFLLIFSFFKVPSELQKKALNWGIICALLMRLLLILLGIHLMNLFAWVTYILGAIVILTGLRLIIQRGKHTSLENNWLLRGMRKMFRITQDYQGNKLFVMRQHRLWLTPLFLVLLLIETTDLVFALDSIPAVLAITRDSFIAYTSNVFAILGLRSLYFVISPWFSFFSHLKIGLGFILIFIGSKMALSPVLKIPVGASLIVVALILIISMIISLLHNKESLKKS